MAEAQRWENQAGTHEIWRHKQEPKVQTCTLQLLLLFSYPVVSDPLQPHGLQHTRPPVPHHLRKFAQVHVPASGTFPMTQLLASPKY